MTNGKNFVGKATAYSATLTNTGAHLVVEAAAIGAETMQQIIETTGTGWDGRLGPNDGRVDSGHMLNDVSYDKQAHIGVSRTGRGSRSARFGWIKNYQDYYGYQDQGFENIAKKMPSEDGGPPGYTLPMNAYETGFYAAREYFLAGLHGITRKTWGK
jgi:hypothetical protein